MTGLVTLAMTASVAAIVIGLLAGFISQWFYLIILFPILMGGAIGAAGSFGVKKGKVRMPLVCGGAGFLAGCLAVLAMHYYEYHSFETAMQQVPDGVRMVAKNFDKFQASRDELPPEIKQLVEEIGKDPETRQALAISGFMEHVDFKAKQGVTLSKAGQGGKGLNLGYIGSYIYWFAELILIAFVSYSVTHSAATQPFCVECENWKNAERLGRFSSTSEAARAALESGNLAEFAAGIGDGGDLYPTVFRCSKCLSHAPIELQLTRVTVNAKGESSEAQICMVTYPGEAFEVFEQLFHLRDAEITTATPQLNESCNESHDSSQST